MFESTLTSKGQTTVPAEIRKMLKLKPNMKVYWISMKPGEVSIVPAPEKTKKEWTDKVCGLLVDDHMNGVEWLLDQKKKDALFLKNKLGIEMPNR